MPSKKRFVDEALLQATRCKPCSICGYTPSDAAHIKSRGAGGPDRAWNIFPACRKHHEMQHRFGWKRFIEWFPVMHLVLTGRGWTIERSGKLFHEKLVNVDDAD